MSNNNSEVDKALEAMNFEDGNVNQSNVRNSTGLFVKKVNK